MLGILIHHFPVKLDTLNVENIDVTGFFLTSYLPSNYLIQDFKVNVF